MELIINELLQSNYSIKDLNLVGGMYNGYSLKYIIKNLYKLAPIEFVGDYVTLHIRNDITDEPYFLGIPGSPPLKRRVKTIQIIIKTHTIATPVSSVNVHVNPEFAEDLHQLLGRFYPSVTLIKNNNCNEVIMQVVRD